MNLLSMGGVQHPNRASVCGLYVQPFQEFASGRNDEVNNPPSRLHKR